MIKTILLIGTLDTKGDELRFVKHLLDDASIASVLVDIGTRRESEGADVTARAVAAHHSFGRRAARLRVARQPLRDGPRVGAAAHRP